MIIYKVTSKTTGKSYIGKTTKRLSERKKAHLKLVKQGKISYFYNSIRTYGEDDFVWEIVDNAETEEQLNELEIQCIRKLDTFKNGYNSTEGGTGGDTISMKSDEQKKNQGAKKGNIPWNYGMDMIGAGYDFFEGRTPRRKFTEEDKQKHSEAIKSSQKYQAGLCNRNLSKQIIIEDEFGRKWYTQKEWRDTLGISWYTAKKILQGMPHEGVSYWVNSKKGC